MSWICLIENFFARLKQQCPRLMASLVSGELADRQSTGKRSAALLVRADEGGWQCINLRVDAGAESIEPVRVLDALQRPVGLRHRAGC